MTYKGPGHRPMYPNLKLQLWKTGIRQNRLAKMLGMDETILSKIVNGFREPSPQMREKIASLLGSDATYRMARATSAKGRSRLATGG